MSEPTILHAAAAHATNFITSVGERPVQATMGPTQMRTHLAGDLTDDGVDAMRVVDELVAQMEPGITAMGSPRYFGFVIGGTLPVALAADWMVGAWDQNAGLASPTPAAAVAEEIAGAWLLDLLGLPSDASFAFVTGCQMAHFTALAAARNRVLHDAGWDVEVDGLVGAPPVRVLAGAERHVTIDRALRFLGLGERCITQVAVDSRGAMDPAALERALADMAAPTIVCAQAGNVNTGAIDPLDHIADATHSEGAWMHVDGAFGLWAAASPKRRSWLSGCERADSWATDTHKWLNTPYDCGFAAVADHQSHRTAMAVSATYLQQGEAVREPLDWNPEFSRRARAVPTYAALRALGRSGVAELVDRLCGCADHFAERLTSAQGFRVLAHELNQVLVAIDEPHRTDAFIHALQEDGTCWMSATTWRDVRCIRISVCNWRTTIDDVDQAVDALVRVLAALPR